MEYGLVGLLFIVALCALALRQAFSSPDAEPAEHAWEENDEALEHHLATLDEDKNEEH